MNKKGQALFLMVVLLPVIILFLGSIIEIGIISYNKIKLQSVTKTIISSCYPSCDEEKINGLYEDNNINLISATYDNNIINVSAKASSLLGKIINKDYYEINLKYYINMEDGIVKYQKESNI